MNLSSLWKRLTSICNRTLVRVKIVCRNFLGRNIYGVPASVLVLLLMGFTFIASQHRLIDAEVISSRFKTGFVSTQTNKYGNGDLSENHLESYSAEIQQRSGIRWTYDCVGNTCKRREAQNKLAIKSLEECWLTCGTNGPLWPYPSYQKDGLDTVKFLPENIQLSSIKSDCSDVTQLIRDAFEIKMNYLKTFPGLHARSVSFFESIWPFSGKQDESYAASRNHLVISISCESAVKLFTLNTDESYEIDINEDTTISSSAGITLSIVISGKTFFGVRHALETLSQLVAVAASGQCLKIVRRNNIKDKPRYTYRGILIDSARNFVPMHILKRIVDAMSYNKLNILHLHLTDSNSFTFHSKRVPQMTQYGAISRKKIYYAHELMELVSYARVRGVKIIAELDAPSHAGNGWQFGPKFKLGVLAYYVNLYENKWKKLCGQPPCGILNPVNKNVYNILEQIYADMFDVFDKDLFHMGGDEVNVDSWTRMAEVQDWIKERNSTGMELWKFFQFQAFERLQKHSDNVTAILWTSSLTADESKTPFLDTSQYIIQVWEPAHSEHFKNLLKQGFSVIVSFVDKFYLDWGEGSWLGKEQDWKFHTWQTLYDTKLNTDQGKYSSQILGGEVPLWSEKISEWQVEVKLWPRAAAFAENLWSDPKRRTKEVYTRLNYHNYRMQQRGIPTSQLQPESCLHFNGHCSSPGDIIK